MRLYIIKANFSYLFGLAYFDITKLCGFMLVNK